MKKILWITTLFLFITVSSALGISGICPFLSIRCLKRSNVRWIYGHVTDKKECCADGCLEIIKNNSNRLIKDNQYCILVEQNGGTVVLYVRTNRYTPIEIMKQIFCDE